MLLYYFVASEVGIANYIQRHFNWWVRGMT